MLGALCSKKSVSLMTDPSRPIIVLDLCYYSTQTFSPILFGERLCPQHQKILVRLGEQ